MKAAITIHLSHAVYDVITRGGIPVEIKPGDVSTEVNIITHPLDLRGCYSRDDTPSPERQPR